MRVDWNFQVAAIGCEYSRYKFKSFDYRDGRLCGCVCVCVCVYWKNFVSRLIPIAFRA